MGANTEGDSGEARRLPRGAQRWFVREARKQIEALQQEGNPHYRDVGLLADRFRTEDASVYLEWQPDDPERFRAGVSGGSWGINFDVFADALRRFAGEVTLDDFLRADLAGTLDSAGVKGGTSALSTQQWTSLAEAAHERRRNWPSSR